MLRRGCSRPERGTKSWRLLMQNHRTPMCACGCGQAPTKQRLYLHGHNRRIQRPTTTDRFWAKVKKSDACWEWQGGRLPHGYGRIVISRKEGAVRAHRFSWELHFGPIPDGMVICHRCDNPPCVRPDHLFVGTQSDNMRDCVNKGRLRIPEPGSRWRKP